MDVSCVAMAALVSLRLLRNKNVSLRAISFVAYVVHTFTHNSLNLSFFSLRFQHNVDGT